MGTLIKKGLYGKQIIVTFGVGVYVISDDIYQQHQYTEKDFNLNLASVYVNNQ